MMRLHIITMIPHNRTMVAIFAHAQVVASSTHAVVGELALQMLLHLHRVEMVIQRKFQCFFALLVKGKDLRNPSSTSCVLLDVARALLHSIHRSAMPNRAHLKRVSPSSAKEEGHGTSLQQQEMR